MSLVETLARPRSWRLPRADGLIQWIVPLLIIVVWQAACSFGLVSARVLPAPSDVVVAGWKLLQSGDLVRNIWSAFGAPRSALRSAAASASHSALPTAFPASAPSCRTLRCRWCVTSRIWR